MAHPDVVLHPVATANAAELVAQHQDPQELVFYAGWFCPFVQRVWIALEERRIPYQYKEVNPYKKEQHFLDINPRGLVPAIEYKGKALYESMVLLEFLEDAYPSYTPKLLPTDPSERAYARIWMDHANKAIVPALMRLLMAESNDADKQNAAREDLYQALRKLLKEIKGPYFAGEQFTLVDVTLAPWIARDYILAQHRDYKREAVGEGWPQYAEALAQRPSLLKTTSDPEKLQVIYGQYLVGTAQSETAKAIRAGRPIP